MLITYVTCKRITACELCNTNSQSLVNKCNVIKPHTNCVDHLPIFDWFYRATACNATHGIENAFLSVRLSVVQTRALCPHSYTR